MDILARLPKKAAPTYPIIDGRDPDLDAQADDLLARYRRDIAPGLNNPEIDGRLARATLFLLPFLANTLPSRRLRALEIGCGRGAKAVPLSGIFGEYLGFDIVEGEIEFARDLASRFGCRNVRFWTDGTANIETILETIEPKVDVIILYAVLEHLTVAEKLDTLRRCWDYLADDGFLFIGEAPNRMVPVDYHSSKLLYFQQMPEELWKLYFHRSPNQAWKNIMASGLADGSFQKKMYRRGLHVGHQEFELGLMELPSLERHIVADNYHPAMLNLYPYEAFEFAKLLEQRALAHFPPHSMVQPVAFPAFFSRYYIEVLLAKRGGLPDRQAGPLRILVPGRGSAHIVSEVGTPATFTDGGAFEVAAADIGLGPGGSARLSLSLLHPESRGTFSVSARSGEVVLEDGVETVIAAIGTFRRHIAIGLPALPYDAFPVRIAACRGASLAVSYVFARAVMDETAAASANGGSRADGVTGLAAEPAAGSPSIASGYVTGPRRPDDLPQPGPRRFVILASMRTGSNAVNASLNQFDGLVCHGEAFNDTFVGLRDDYFSKFGFERTDLARRDADRRGFLTRLFADPDAKAVGLHMFPGDAPDILEMLLRDPAVLKIGLRRSLFQSYASLLIVRKTNVWRVMSGSRGPESETAAKVQFDAADFERYKKRLDEFWAFILSVLKETKQSFYPIWYSQINDPRTLNEIAEYIGIDSRKTSIRQLTRRQNPVDLKDKIENWEELFAYAKVRGLENQLY
jgi:hypothetical protein